AGEVDQVPVTGRDEVGQELLGPVHDPPVVHVHHAGRVLVASPVDGAGERDAGVVDHQVHRPEVVGDGARVLGHGRLFGHVEPVRPYVRGPCGAGERD